MSKLNTLKKRQVGRKVLNSDADISMDLLSFCISRHLPPLAATCRHLPPLADTSRYFLVLPATSRHFPPLPATSRHFPPLPATSRYFPIFPAVPGNMSSSQLFDNPVSITVRRVEVDVASPTPASVPSPRP